MRNILFCICILMSLCCSCKKDVPEDREVFYYLDSLSILYWNILEGMNMDKENDYRNFIEWIGNQNPDICVWCEGNDNSDGVQRSIEEMCDIWKNIARQYGHNNVYVAGYSYSYPQIITSRYSFKIMSRIGGDFSPIQAGHGSGWLRIIVNDDYYNIVTTHLSSFIGREADYGRLNEMNNILDYSVRSHYCDANQKWLMIGDFNTYSLRDTNKTNLLSKGYSSFLVTQFIEDCSPYIDIVSYHYPNEFIKTTKRGNRIDYAYATSSINMQVSDIRVIYDDFTTNHEHRFNSNSVFPSDHFPIFIQLVLK